MFETRRRSEAPVWGTGHANSVIWTGSISRPAIKAISFVEITSESERDCRADQSHEGPLKLPQWQAQGFTQSVQNAVRGWQWTSSPFLWTNVRCRTRICFENCHRILSSWQRGVAENHHWVSSYDSEGETNCDWTLGSSIRHKWE